MAIRWADSADKHGIAREDALNAILNQIYHVEQFDELHVRICLSALPGTAG
jgi:hypothetical protein